MDTGAAAEAEPLLELVKADYVFDLLGLEKFVLFELLPWNMILTTYHYW